MEVRYPVPPKGGGMCLDTLDDKTKCAFGGAVESRSQQPRTLMYRESINPSIDPHTRKAWPTGSEDNTPGVGCYITWTEEEDMLEPLEKLTRIDDRIEQLQRSRDFKDECAANELCIYKMAYTRLVYGDQDPKFAEALADLANSYMDLKMYARAEPHLRQALSIMETFDDDNADALPLIPYMGLRIGVCLHHMNQQDEAIKELRRALQRHRSARGETDSHYYYVVLAKAYCAKSADEFNSRTRGKGATAGCTDKLAKAEEMLRKAWEIKEKQSGADGGDEELGQIYVEQAKLHQKRVAIVEESLRKIRRVSDKDQTDKLKEKAEQQRLYVQSEREEAVDCYKKAYEVYQRNTALTTELEIKAANIAYQIGNLVWHCEDREESAEYLREACRTYGQLCGIEDHRTLYLMKDNALVELGHPPRHEPRMFAHSQVTVMDPRKARVELEPGGFSDTDDEDEGPPHRRTGGGVTFDWEDADVDSECVEKGIQKLKKLSVLERNSFGDESPQLAYTYCLLGECHAKKGNWGKACSLMEQAVAIRESYYGSGHAKTVAVKQKLARAKEQRKSKAKRVAI